MAQAQLRDDELVAYPVTAGLALGPFDEIAFPEKEVNHLTRRKPLKKGTYSSGSTTALGDVEGMRVYDPNTDDALIAALEKIEGDPEAAKGTLPYHAAPGHIPSSRPIVGRTYDTVLLSIELVGGVNVEGENHQMLKCVWGINGLGK